MRVKMTKALSLLLCLLMLVNMLPVSALASEATPDEPSAQTEQQPAECQHTGGSATCKALAVCDNCKQSYGEYAAHSGGTATCTALAVCETCGEGYGALAEHSYENGVCTVCNGADPDYVPPCEHTGGTATCTAQAVCTVCAAAYGELADHSYDNGVCVCGEVCAHAEYAEGKCTLCGAAQPEVACTCETDDPAYHAPFCALYERTGDACTCEVKCTEENHNIYCEVCYFDGIAACTGGEEDQIPYVTEGSCGTGVSYTLDNGVLTISGTGEMENWSSASNNSAPWYNDRTSINEIVISSGVRSIGNWAFNGCKNLTSVTIPDSVTSIGNDAFNDCGVLTSVTIPDSVESIGYSAFHTCSGLTSVTIGNSVKSIGIEAFCNCRALTSVTIPNSVTSIGDDAFGFCIALESVTIGNSVESIGEDAFIYCAALRSVTAPCNRTVEGKRLYDGEKLLYTFDDSVTIDIEHEAIDTGAATCTKQAVCGTCGASYGELAPNNHASTEFTYAANEDGTTHKKMHKCCNAVAAEAENHTPDAAGYTVGTDGTHSFTCVCDTTVTEAHTYVDGTCVCDAVKTYTITLHEETVGVKIVAVNGEAKEILPGGTFTVPHGQELKVKFENTLSKWETGVYCDGYVFIDQNLIMCNYNEATNTLTIPGNKVTGDFVIDAYAYVRVQFDLHGGMMTDECKESLEEGFGYTWNAETSTLKAGYGFNFALRPEYFQLAGHTLAGAKVDGSEEVVKQLKIRSDMTVDILWECDGTAILTPVPAKDATCMEAGNLAHYVCTCGKLYAEDQTTVLTPDEVKTAVDENAHSMDAATGSCRYGCGKFMAVVKVDDTFYESIHKALRAAEGINGCTLTLLDDITLTSTSSYASHVNTGTFTLDLNGKTLSSNKRTLEVMGSADLTIRDGIGGGKIVSTGGSAVYLSGGKLTIDSGTFEGTDGVFLSYDSTLIVKGGTFTGSRAMITGLGSACEIDLTAIDPAGFTLKNNGSGTFAPTLPSGYAMINGSGTVVTSLSAEESATVKASLENATVTLDKDTFTYDGQEHKPTVTVVLGDKPLTLGVDYTVIYAQAMTVQDGKPFKWFGTGPSESECINAGSLYFAVVEGIGNYYTEDTVTLCENFVIAPRPLTVKADDQTILVGGQINEESVTVTEGSLVAGHTLTASIQLGQYTEAGSVVNQPGFHEDVLTILELSCDIMDGEEYVTNNYSISFVSGNLTVVEHVHEWSYSADGDTITAECKGTIGTCPIGKQTVTVKAEGKPYDGTPVTAELDGSIDGVTAPEITYTGNTNAGTHTASITIEGKTASVKFTIEKATVTVTADAKSKPYGTDNPTLTYTSEGLLGDDVLTGALETTATKTSNVGEYDITVGSLGSSNYTIDFVGAKLTITKADARITSEPQPVSGLTFNGGNQNLITAGTANGGTMQYRLSQNESFSSAISTGKNAGTYTVYYKVVGDANHNDSTEGSVTVTIAKATATAAKIPVQKHFHDYATANTLALSQHLPADRGETTYTLGTITGNFFADGTAVTETGSLTYTTRAMDAAATGSIAVNMVMENYEDVTLTVPVELVAVTAQTETRIVKNGLTEVPAGLANTGFNTLEKLKAEQQRVLALRLGQDPQSSIAHYDVKLQFTPDGGKTWVDATEENFPADGLTVTLPYPSGTGKDSHKFVVSHMFTTGNKAGTTETPTVTKTAEGIKFTVTGLSPVSVAWSAIPFDVSIGAVTNGTVYVSPAHTTAGTQVTITVIPKSGYKLSTLTVKDAAGNSYAVSTDNNGKYYFTMPAANVTVTATFSKISTATADPTNPKTGDDFGVIFWSGMMMTSLFGMAVMVLEKKKFYQ